ncbi:hypothetical protein GCM10028807_27550 [Spirosoma daeguense]
MRNNTPTLPEHAVKIIKQLRSYSSAAQHVNVRCANWRVRQENTGIGKVAESPWVSDSIFIKNNEIIYSMNSKAGSLKQSIPILLALVILSNACTVRVPMGQIIQTSHHGAQRIQPSYQVSKKGGKLAGYLGVTAGAALLLGGLGYAQSQDKNGNPYSDQQRINNAKSLGLTGLYVGGLYGIYVLVGKRKPSRIEQVAANNFNNWLSDYNRKQNQNFVKYDQSTYPYLLIPRNNVAAYESEEQRTRDEQEKQRVLAEQRRKELEEKERIAKQEQEAKEKKEREEQERKAREYAALVAKNPDKLDWKPLIEFNEDIIFPSYVLSRASSRLIKLIGCEDPSFHEANDCASVLGIVVTSPSTDFEFSLEISDTDGRYIVPNKRNYVLKERGKRYILFPTIAWKTESLRNQEQEFVVNLEYKLAMPISGITSQRFKTVKMKTIYDCIFGYQAKGEPFKNRRFMFTAYVNEKDPTVDLITQEALKMRVIKSFGGYQGDRSDVIDEVAAIWASMQNRGIKYSSLTGSDLSLTTGIVSQYVQPLSKVYQYAQANCIDGTVAFASVLKKIGIDPLIVTIPGHAFLGFCTKPKTRDGQTWKERDPVFLETTLIGSKNLSLYTDTMDKIQVSRDSFDKALSIGTKRFSETVLPNLSNERAYSVLDITFYRELIDPIGK